MLLHTVDVRDVCTHVGLECTILAYRMSKQLALLAQSACMGVSDYDGSVGLSRFCVPSGGLTPMLLVVIMRSWVLPLHPGSQRI